MRAPTGFSFLAGWCLVVAGLFVCLRLGAAQPAATGSIEGRVLNTRNGEYVERARVTVEGTSLETFTDADGVYRLSNVPAGTARVRVFFTGLLPQTDEVTVAADRTAQHHIQLLGFERQPDSARDGIVRLSEFVVGTSREMDGAAIAINEQRFAPNITNVISSDEFGGVAEGNVAEVLKFLPGVTIENSGGNLRFASINGVSSDNVPVTIDGFSLASAQGGGTGRAVQIDMVSNNSLARIEVTYSPTPESQGAALAGSVNMVPRSSFERSKPVFNGSVYLMMRDNARDLRPVPGPRSRGTRNVHPGFDFSYVAPVNARFGYTLSAGHSTQYSAQDISTNTWRGTGAATNGTAFPHTTPDRPYLTSFTVLDAPKVTARNSIGATIDYKLAARDRLSFSLQYSSFNVWFKNNTAVFNLTQVPAGSFTPTSVRGAGEIQLTRGERNRYNRTYMPTLTWRHDGPVWKALAGAGFSDARDRNNASAKGFFRNSTARRTGVTIAFDEIFYLRPGVITVTDTATGAPIDPYKLSNYVLASGNDNQDRSTDQQRTAYANLRRDFFGRVPLSLKAGLDFRHAQRELRGGNPTWTFVGGDGRTSTTPAAGDDSAVPFADLTWTERIPPYGFPATEGVSNVRLLDFFRSNPTHFTVDQNAAYRSQVSESKHAGELVSAAYLRGDLSFFERRLKLVGGLRAEQTNIEAEGPLTDPTRNIRRDAQGRPILGPNGQPQPITTNALEASQLTFIDRGTRTDKEYLRLFPNLNASYNVRENLIARAAYYHSIGRPSFNQYAGGLTLPNTDNPPSAGNRITVNNAAIKPWMAETMNVRLEYYFGGVGLLSVGAFRRDFTNSFGGAIFAPSAEFLSLYGLDAETYGGYDVSTQVNVAGTVRMTGVDFNYKQVLSLLPRWARGVQIFANGSAQRATGPSLGSFSGSNYIPRSGSWGVSLTRERYNLRGNWNYRGRQRRGQVGAGNSIDPATFNWASKRLYIDVSGEYYFGRKIAVFANLRNVGATYEDAQVFGPNTPAHARFRQRLDHGSLWTFGLKGSF
ncbi:MAG: TonB-dependent receptor [Opitutaceae bacterium]|nr:TonB-dependent receptor [Opitutaceae bacterium]